jgi:hypothetical protein
MELADRRAYGPIGGPAGRNGFIGYPDVDDVRKLLVEIEKWATCDHPNDGGDPRPLDRTWGYFVFCTDYDAATRGRLPQAMANWVRIVERHLETARGPDEWKEELRTRFKLELVEDEDELAGASDDRIRENFRAMMRDMDLLPEEDSWVPLARYFVCLVLDANAVEMLAGIQFPDKDPHWVNVGSVWEFDTFSKMTVKAIDANWDREDERDSYRGVGQVSINGLQELYLRITRDACNKAMEDLHPLDGYPGDN